MLVKSSDQDQSSLRRRRPFNCLVFGINGMTILENPYPLRGVAARKKWFVYTRSVSFYNTFLRHSSVHLFAIRPSSIRQDYHHGQHIRIIPALPERLPFGLRRIIALHHNYVLDQRRRCHSQAPSGPRQADSEEIRENSQQPTQRQWTLHRDRDHLHFQARRRFDSS